MERKTHGIDLTDEQWVLRRRYRKYIMFVLLLVTMWLIAITCLNRIMDARASKRLAQAKEDRERQQRQHPGKGEMLRGAEARVLDRLSLEAFLWEVGVRENAQLSFEDYARIRSIGSHVVRYSFESKDIKVLMDGPTHLPVTIYLLNTSPGVFLVLEKGDNGKSPLHLETARALVTEDVARRYSEYRNAKSGKHGRDAWTVLTKLWRPGSDQAFECLLQKELLQACDWDDSLYIYYYDQQKYDKSTFRAVWRFVP